MNKENCALKLVDEIILYYDARSKKHQIIEYIVVFGLNDILVKITVNTVAILYTLAVPSFFSIRCSFKHKQLAIK